MSNTALTATNQIKISLDGTVLNHELMNSLLEVEVDSSVDVPTMAILRFHDDELKWVDTGPFAPGKALEISFTNPTTNSFQAVFKGEVTAIEPTFTDRFTSVLSIRAYDRSHRLTRGTNNKVFLQVTDGDVVTQIAQTAGLTANCGPTTQVHKHIYQHNQTNLEFLHERARHLGYEIVVDDRTLHFRPPTGAGQVTLKWGVTLRSFRPRYTLAGQVNEVVVRGWDPAAKQPIVGQASSSASAPQVGIGGWGGALAQTAFSGAAKSLEVREPVTNQAEADTFAKALLDASNAGFLEADGVAYGNPAIIAGAKLTLEKLGTKFSGTYVVTSAIHLYSTTAGYDTHFIVEGSHRHLLADLMRESSDHGNGGTLWGGLVPAIVTNNKDPDNMGRVKLKFPWIDPNLESNWARVIAPGAGNMRGIFWLPEVNDEVMVAFEHGDFNHPYIVGGVWNGQDATVETANAAVAADGKVKIRTLKTRTGHLIRFTDEDAGGKIEIIDAKQGTTITLDGAQKSLTIICKGDVKLDATGKVNLTATGNVDMSSSGNFTVKATGNLNVEATGNLTLKGQMVNIN
jgi:phage protein D/phage baseplate assembly protein gpV